ncbi:MAG: ABC transporter substrate-binding protein [Candidatus Babeliaceae bacterium]|nr:ABC transporter substrate-binding protein [Candidatus Babeliaceae bacterium]
MVHKKLIFCFTGLLLSLNSKNYNLADVTRMAFLYNEDIEPGNNNYFDPDFSSYLAKERPNLFKRALRMVGIWTDPFPINDFIQILKDVSFAQKSRGRLGDFILATQLALNDKIIILGNIQGAFHSLVRDLQELMRQGIIDNSFKIVDPHYKIIFNGTAVCRSPYILQTLFVMLLLMQQNPDKVFCLKSDYEKESLWKDRGFSRQVDIVYKKYASQIFSGFTDFIETMPLAFFGNYADCPEKLLKITAYHEFKNETIENETGAFFNKLAHNQVDIWHLDKKEKSQKPAHVAVLIQGFLPTVLIAQLEPLMFLEPIASAVQWRVFSAPTYSFQKLYGFKDDAFATIVFGKEISSSIIELYAHNRMAKDEFKLKGSFDIDTGIARKASKENLLNPQEKIYIGSSLDLSKSNFIMGDRVRTGISLAMRQTNESGGIHGKEVQAIIFDDEYTPYIARNNLDRLEKEFGVKTVLLPIGTPTILAAEDLIRSGEILAAFPITGSPALRLPDWKGSINFRPTFEVETEILITYLMKESKFKNFGFFYQDDEYGQGCMKKAREVLLKNDIKKWVEIPYARNTTNFDKQREILKNGQIEALGCFSASQATQEFLRQVGAAPFASIQLFALAFVADDVFESFVKKELGLKCLFSRDVPNPRLSQLEIVKEYRQLMDEIKKPYDSFSLEAYICTSILCDMMKKVSGTVTHEAIIEQFQALNNYDFKGLTLTFRPEDRQISKRVWLDFQDGKDWQVAL